MRRAPVVAPRATLPTLGRWEIVRPIYEGSMFRVVQARPAEHELRSGDPHYALKVLLPRWSHVPRAVELLQREALVGRTVSHAHLVPVLSSRLNEAPQYVALPWLAGETLAARLTSGALAPPLAVWIARQVAEALEVLHTAGWLHGDVKPDNVMINAQGHATLIDLGFARRRGERLSTFDECLRYTPAYVPPELFTSLEPDPRGDLYSLGVTLYEAVSGVRPFNGGTIVDLVRQHKESRAADLGRVAPDAPSALCRLVHEMLAKDPLRRPRSAREVADRLLDLEIELFDWRR